VRLQATQGVTLDQKIKRGGKSCKGRKQVINSEEKLKRE
jgi:hypothetical protein